MRRGRGRANGLRYDLRMITAAVVILIAAGAAAATGWLLWWAAHRSALWNFVVAIVMGIGTLVAAVLIAYLMVRWRSLL
jgi:hypothetical protein